MRQIYWDLAVGNCAIVCMIFLILGRGRIWVQFRSPPLLLSAPPSPIQIRKPIYQKHFPHKFHLTCYFIALSTPFCLDCNKRGFISEFGLYFHGEYFQLNRALFKHWSQLRKLQKILVQESESTFTFESNCPKASVPPFLVSSAPPPPSSPSILRPRPPLW